MKTRLACPSTRAVILALALGTVVAPTYAAEDLKALLEILLEKGVITQDEYNNKIKKVQESEEVRQFTEAQDVRRATQAIEKKAEEERKFNTTFYGQVSAGYYSASNMKNSAIDAAGMSDQPKANNRVGVRVSRELDADTTAMATVESNLSTRTGAVGKDAGASGTGVSPIFDREANFRLISKPYGTLIVGRGPNLQTDLSGAFDARQNWNFGGLKTIGRYAGFHSASGINRADKMIRYISPVIEGFNFDGAASFGGVPGDDDYGNNIYLGGRYKKDNFELGYNHIEAKLSTNKTNNRVDFFAAKYTYEALTVNLGYAITRNPLDATATLSATTPGGKADVDTLFSGAVYRFTPKLSANLGWYQVKDKTSGNGKNDVTMVATGLTWSPYKEWDFFIDYAASARKANATSAFSIYDAWRPDTNNKDILAAGTKDQAGVSVGALFKF